MQSHLLSVEYLEINAHTFHIFTRISSPTAFPLNPRQHALLGNAGNVVNKTSTAPPLVEHPSSTANSHQLSKNQNKPKKINTSSYLPVWRSLGAEWSKGLGLGRSTEHGLAATLPSAWNVSSRACVAGALSLRVPSRGHLLSAAFSDHPTGAVPSYSDPLSALFSLENTACSNHPID